MVLSCCGTLWSTIESLGRDGILGAPLIGTTPLLWLRKGRVFEVEGGREGGGWKEGMPGREGGKPAPSCRGGSNGGGGGGMMLGGAVEVMAGSSGL